MSRCGRQRVHSRDFPISPTPIGLAAMWSPAPRQMAEPIRPLTCAAGVHQALAPVLDVASEAPPGPRPRNLQQRPVPVVVAPSLRPRTAIDDATTGVAATSKHFVGYSASEGGLKTATTHLGSHKLHDLYAPPFEAAVGDGELQSVIDFHSPVYDIPVAASRAILTDS